MYCVFSVANVPESSGVVAASSLQIYAGQSTECNLTLVNTSNVPVECFDLELTYPNRSTLTGQVFSFRLAIFCVLILLDRCTAVVFFFVFFNNFFILSLIA